MIFTFVAKTASGKDTLARLISEELNIPISVSTTSRAMRNGEIQDREYHFVDDEYFNDKSKFIEIREYEVYDGSIWLYGYEKEEFEHDNCIAIVDPNGNQELKKYFGENNVTTFYIYTSEDKLKERLIKRGDNPLEIDRRLNDDEVRFQSFIESGKYYLIDNDGKLEDAVNQMKTILNDIIKE